MQLGCYLHKAGFEPARSEPTDLETVSLTTRTFMLDLFALIVALLDFRILSRNELYRIISNLRNLRCTVEPLKFISKEMNFYGSSCCENP